MTFSLQELLIVENDSRVLDYKFQTDGVLMWPYVRYRIFKSAIIQNTNISPDLLGPISVSAVQKVKYLLHTFSKSLLQSIIKPRAELLYILNDNSCVLQEGAYVNRVGDPLVEMFKDHSVVYERTTTMRYKVPRRLSQVRYLDAIALRAVMGQKLTIVTTGDKQRISEFVIFLKQNVPCDFSDEFWRQITQLLLACSAKLPSWKKSYEAMFNRHNPRALFMEDACYGAHPHVLKWARERGIITVEMQHGFLGTEQPAYVYGNHFLDSATYTPYLPDYFLSYGPFWSASLRLPKAVRIVDIGNPQLEDARINANAHKNKASASILFTSSAVEPERLINFVSEFHRISKGKFDIKFRPHPAEKAVAKTRYNALANLGITICLDGDLYEAFSGVSIVFGEFSTVLYEAIAFKLPVYLLSSEYSAYHTQDASVFREVSKPNELLSLILKGEDAPAQIRADEVWQPLWRKNFQSFIEKRLLC